MNTNRSLPDLSIKKIWSKLKRHDDIIKEIQLTTSEGHNTRKDNPHEVTAEQIGLGNVSNVSTNNQTPTYTEATTLTKLSSGEKLSVAFGKIAKAISSLISHLANQSNPHKVTASQVGAMTSADVVDNFESKATDLPASARTVYALNKKAVNLTSNTTHVSGETVKLYYVGGAIITSGGKEIYFSVHTPKSLKNVSSFTFKKAGLIIRQNNNYLLGSVDTYASSGFTITLSKENDNTVCVKILLNSAPANVENNSVVAISCPALNVVCN